MKQHGFGGRGGDRPGKSIAGILLAGWIAGCATAPAQLDQRPPGPSAVNLAAAEAALQEAQRKDRGQDHAIDQHLAQAERALADAKDRAARGEARQAGLLLARAQADIELGQALGRRERALAEAEVMEKQLVEARATPPSPGATPEVTP